MNQTHARLNELVRRAREGDVPAFGLVVAETQAMACAIALSVLRDPGLAQDAAQEAYLRAFRRLRNWRVGIEARISHLKRTFGLRRTRLRRLGGARTWVGLGIFAYNLQRMTAVAR